MDQGAHIPGRLVEPVEMLDGVYRRTLGTTDTVMLVEITLSQDAVVPMHSHPNEQVGYVVRGEIELTIGEAVYLCQPGDSYAIPGGVEHMGRAISECVVVDCFSPPREDYR